MTRRSVCQCTIATRATRRGSQLYAKPVTLRLSFGTSCHPPSNIARRYSRSLPWMKPWRRRAPKGWVRDRCLSLRSFESKVCWTKNILQVKIGQWLNVHCISLVAIDLTVQSDPKYKKYSQQVEKRLAAFESMHEWPDFIAFLKQLLGVRHVHPKCKPLYLMTAIRPSNHTPNSRRYLENSSSPNAFRSV